MLVPEQHSDGVSVALRKESVDRNSFQTNNFKLASVALRKESVDRNIQSSAVIV